LILEAAEKEADVIVWDGGNNDTPFFKPDLNIVVFDPHRAGHETTYHPGETNMLMADVAVINKVDSAEPEKVEQVRKTIQAHNPGATIILADSAVWVDDPEPIKGRHVLVVEDGPTLTHGEMTYGAGVIAARRFGAASLVDPRPYLKGTLVETFKSYPHIGRLLPAMGYGLRQIKDLEETINACPCDLVLSATPIDLTALVAVNKPVVRVRYEYGDNSAPTLEDVIREKLSFDG
jgi:predicted GTPase